MWTKFFLICEGCDKFENKCTCPPVNVTTGRYTRHPLREMSFAIKDKMREYNKKGDSWQ